MSYESIMQTVNRNRVTEDSVRSMDAHEIVDWIHGLEDEVVCFERLAEELREALKDAMRTARKDFATKEEFEAAYPEQVAALAKARGES